MALRVARTREEVEAGLAQNTDLMIVGFFGSFSEISNDTLPEFLEFGNRHDDLQGFVVDVSLIKGLHKEWDVSSVPTVIAVEGGRVSRRVQGAQTADFFERTLIPAEHPLVRSGDPTAKPAPRVTVYSSDSCSWCTKVKAYLRANRVQFREVNVSRDANAAAELQRRSGQSGVPQIDINGHIVVGFDRPRLASLLGLRSEQAN